MRKRLETAEMRFVWKELRISWRARKTSEELLRRAGAKKELMTMIREKQIGFVGHILRENGLGKECLLGIIEGRRARGTQRFNFIDGIRYVTCCETLLEVLRLAEDRSLRRSTAAYVNLDR